MNIIGLMVYVLTVIVIYHINIINTYYYIIMYVFVCVYV